MTIADARARCKSLLARAPHDLLFVLVLLLACSASFGLGLLSGREGHLAVQAVAAAAQPATADARIVASKGGTKYYPPGCSGASRISDANKVYFASAAAAEGAGYTLAANCK